MAHEDPGRRRRVHVRLLQFVDVIAYGLVVTVLMLVLGVLVSFPLGGGWLGTKYFLFVGGLLIFGYATLALRPSAPYKKRRADLGGDSSGSFLGRLMPIGDKLPDADPPGGPPGSDGGAEFLPGPRSRVERVVDRVLPPRFRLHVASRPPVALKLFLGSLFVLGTSFVMETVFGVAVTAAA